MNTRSRRKSSKETTTPKKVTGGGGSDAESIPSFASGGSSSTRQRLAHWIEKQLAEDIESAGGLWHFDKGKRQGVKELCDHRTYTLEQPEFYGELGAEEKDLPKAHLRKKKKRGSSLSTEKEKESTKTKTPKKPTTKKIASSKKKKDTLPATISTKIGDDILDDLSLDSLSLEDKAEPEAERKIASSATPKTTKAPRLSTTPKQTNQTPRVTRKKATMSDFDDIVIDIDASSPGYQGEGVFCFSIADFTHGNIRWKGGIEIEMIVDTRDTSEDLYLIRSQKRLSELGPLWKRATN
ncbi:hypothetical protein SEMRO_3970_G352260.1 [Seminavis robusta]|uniref:Uncharacterized protein n=1 Tax=Seminavis robusta TaxID=568900 RepID=A0A9N8HZR7_9STRA|nr:hypothetical protein SEMRO_3970_G352260.1 [Seminavis robusta]|eukprot:Sro3970_g352260.1 n/a (295) ;mRNA; f:1160-2390